jgi:hypothetical protein
VLQLLRLATAAAANERQDFWIARRDAAEFFPVGTGQQRDDDPRLTLVNHPPQRPGVLPSTQLLDHCVTPEPGTPIRPVTVIDSHRFIMLRDGGRTRDRLTRRSASVGGPADVVGTPAWHAPRAGAALASRLPASVLADLTGINIHTAVAWNRLTGGDWTEYVGQRAPDAPNQP